MKRILLRAAGAAIGLALVAVAAVLLTSTRKGPLPTDAPGYLVTQIDAPRRGGTLTLYLWYPAVDTVPVSLIGQNALFYGFHGRAGAEGDGKPHPVIVLSHGSGGNAERLGWIASALAARGFIVAATNHPGTTSNDSLPARTVQPWERSGDVSDILDHLTAAVPAGIQPDMDRVAVLGFSLGGATALLAGGARLSKDLFLAYCADATRKDDCEWLKAGNLDLTAIDSARYEADLEDARIRAVVAVDPALSQAMTVESLAAIKVPVKIINLGDPGAVPAAMRADVVAELIPGAVYRTVSGAAHFSFLPRCSWFGVFVISLAGDDNICSDRGLRDRGAVQGELAEDISQFLHKVISGG